MSVRLSEPSSTSSRDPMDRRAWHRRAARPVLGWMVALLVLAFVHRWVPQSRWLLVHLFTLGLVTNSILIWGQHFTDTLLRSRAGDRGSQLSRLWVLNLGIVITSVGMVAGVGAMAIGGAAVIGLALCWYAWSLLTQLRGSLGGRFAFTVRWYVAAALLLPVGAVLGGAMALSQPEPWQGKLLLAHQLVNVLGFVGLTAIGTLITLWPTVLRTKMEPDQERAGRRALWAMAGGVLIAAVAALAGWMPVVAVGLVAYLIGLVLIGIPLLRCALRKPPQDFPAYSIGAALVWLVGCLVGLAVLLLRTDHPSLAAGQVQRFTVPFVAGFLAQLLFGAMSYLMPTVMGGGPKVVRASCAEMNRFGAARVAVLNASLVAFLASDNSWIRVLTSLLALVALASIVVLIVRMVRLVTRGCTKVTAPTADTEPVKGNPAQRVKSEKVTSGVLEAPSQRRDFVEAVMGLGGVLGAVAIGRAVGGSGTPTAAQGAVAATGQTTRVRVVANGMRFHPDTVQVPVGNRLEITLVNEDPEQVHDLYLATGASTKRLPPGQTSVLDAGVIGAPVEGWCSIVGHRSMGMLFHVTTPGAGAPAGPPVAVGSTRQQVDLSKPPGPGFRTRSAVLEPVLPSPERSIQLTVTEADQELAPGVIQHAMTYNGRVMGPTVNANLGDRISCRLVNRGSMGHSVDFHAGTVAPDNTMRTIAPGESLDYRFVTHRAGIWLYHCSTMPMSAHIAAGMYGAVVVPPRGIAKVDREFLLIQQEAYLGPPGGETDSAKIANEAPDLTIWNGHANQYVFDPLTARVGERVRIWVLAAGPSRGISFHVVGAQFDTVFKEGAYLLRPNNPEGGGAQALDLAAAQGGFVELVFDEPGTYTFVNHSFVEMERGARGLIKVTA
ncbi:nitrite reductase [Enemella dayhoffiae]|uniref:Copper-containing nitrite reductase n=1 Tax=Enemella dayhoffiae TaxID=2016507 RepID=A0A255HBU6_9ACTN|nr:multicopper oxidase domain-containing protein [Enemella dayhoffiae]OYO25199.1 nitrite reductase [Enemella dayhoffiae]